MNARFKQYLAKVGIAGFLFFLIKGLAWLTIPIIVAHCYSGG